jgi:hypothetical protein
MSSILLLNVPDVQRGGLVNQSLVELDLCRPGLRIEVTVDPRAIKAEGSDPAGRREPGVGAVSAGESTSAPSFPCSGAMNSPVYAATCVRSTPRHCP